VAAVEGQAATVTLRRFGLLDAAAETHVYPLAMPADMGQDTPEVYNPAITNDLVFLNKSDIQIRFFDATSDGARASFRLSVAVGTTARVTQWAWRPCGWIELAITGPGDAAAVALEVVATRAQTVGPYENITSGGDTAMWESTPTTVSVTGGDDYPTCSGTWTEHDSTEFAHGDDPGGTWRAVLLQSTGVAEGSGTSTSIRRMHHIVAVNYDAADQRRVIECSLASQVITTKTLSMSVSSEAERVYALAPLSGACVRGSLLSNSPRQAVIEFHRTDESRLIMELRDNGALVESYDSGPCVSVLQQTWQRGGGTAMTLTAQQVDVSFADDHVMDGSMVVGFYTTSGSQAQALRYALIDMERRLGLYGPELAGLSWYGAPCLYSPRVVGLCLHRRDRRGGFNINTRHTTVADQTLTAPTAFASRHPINGDLALDSVAVCWV
jgi:hypothetical protein